MPITLLWEAVVLAGRYIGKVACWYHQTVAPGG